MRRGFIELVEFVQALREAGACTHVRAGRDVAPETAIGIRECRRPKCAFSRGDGLLVKRTLFCGRGGAFREQHHG
jgi:hypothetical protein